MLNLFLIGLLISASPVLASCYSSFACSISNLQVKENKNIIENYFAKNVVEPNYFTGSTSIITYNDLFLFNTIV